MLVKNVLPNYIHMGSGSYFLQVGLVSIYGTKVCKEGGKSPERSPPLGTQFCSCTSHVDHRTALLYLSPHSYCTLEFIIYLPSG